jgi:hypothetical protein
LMNRRPDLSLEASPGDNFAWKIMIPFKSPRNFRVSVRTIRFGPEDRIPAWKHFQATILPENYNPIS